MKLMKPAGWTKTMGGVLAPDDVAESIKKGQKQATRVVFEGTEDSRWTSDWYHPEVEPTELVCMYMRKMRDRIRALARNSPWLVSLLNAWVNNVCGDADGWELLPLTFTDDLGDELNDAQNRVIRRLWGQFQSGVDINERQPLWMLLREAERELAEVGEVFIWRRILSGQAARGRRIPMAVEILTSERLDESMERSAGNGRNRITHGIEYDQFGRRIAYHFDAVNSRGVPDPTIPKMVLPASQVDHRWLKLRAGMERGIPPLYAAMLLLRDFDNGCEFEMEAWMAQARIPGAIMTRHGPVVGDSVERDEEDERPITRVDGAAFLQLYNDEDIKFPEPSRPSNRLPTFAEFASRSLAKVAGFSYEATTGDYGQGSFSSLRLGWLADKQTTRRLQDEICALQLSPLYGDFLLLAVQLGLIEGLELIDYVSDPSRYKAHRFVKPGFEHHDPQEEAVGAGLRIDLGLSTRQEECAALGRNWEDVARQRAREDELYDELGLTRITVGGAAVVTGSGAQFEEAETDDEEKAATPPARQALFPFYASAMHQPERKR